MDKKIYVLATVNSFDNGTTTLLDHFSDFKDAKSIAISNAAAQKKIEGESFVSEWVHDEEACKMARYSVPAFQFNQPLFMIETTGSWKDETIKTYRAVFEYELH